MLSRGEESCGEVGLNSGFSGFFMVGEDMSACWDTHTHAAGSEKDAPSLGYISGRPGDVLCHKEFQHVTLNRTRRRDICSPGRARRLTSDCNSP